MVGDVAWMLGAIARLDNAVGKLGGGRTSDSPYGPWGLTDVSQASSSKMNKDLPQGDSRLRPQRKRLLKSLPPRIFLLTKSSRKSLLMVA